MAKGQKKSNRETRKPKQDKPKPAASRPAGSSNHFAWPASSGGKSTGG